MVTINNTITCVSAHTAAVQSTQTDYTHAQTKHTSTLGCISSVFAHRNGIRLLIVPARAGPDCNPAGQLANHPCIWSNRHSTRRLISLCGLIPHGHTVGALRHGACVTAYSSRIRSLCVCTSLVAHSHAIVALVGRRGEIADANGVRALA
jgi:hypothetical protein